MPARPPDGSSIRSAPARGNRARRPLHQAAPSAAGGRAPSRTRPAPGHPPGASHRWRARVLCPALPGPDRRQPVPPVPASVRSSASMHCARSVAVDGAAGSRRRSRRAGPARSGTAQSQHRAPGRARAGAALPPATAHPQSTHPAQAEAAVACVPMDATPTDSVQATGLHPAACTSLPTRRGHRSPAATTTRPA